MEGVAECEVLEKSVETGTLDLSIDLPDRPHVTGDQHPNEVTRDRGFDELADFECVFEVDGFWLYTYDDDPGWVPTRAFELR